MNRLWIIIVLLLLLLAGCSGGGSSSAPATTATTPTQPTDPPPAIPTVVISGPTTVVAGQVIKLVATLTYPSGDDDPNVNITANSAWVTSAASVATVYFGQITGVAAGTATLTASYITSTNQTIVSAPFTVTVTAAPVTPPAPSPPPAPVTTTLTITGTSSVLTGQVEEIIATLSYSDGTPSEDVSSSAVWLDSNSQVATIAQGEVTALAAGTTTITASYLSVTSNQFVLTVTEPAPPPPAAPVVIFVGDSVMNSWLTPAVLAANPGWVAQTSPSGQEETTQQILARFGAATSLHPQVVVIEAGTWSASTPSYTDPEGWDACTGSPNPSGADDPANDVACMVEEAQAAGAYVVVCMIPPWGLGPLQQQIDQNDAATTISTEEDIAGFYYDLYQMGYPTYQGQSLVDFYEMMDQTPAGSQGGVDAPMEYIPADTQDGVNPAGGILQQMVTAVEGAITAAEQKNTSSAAQRKQKAEAMQQARKAREMEP
jgi:hypothetical protein